MLPELACELGHGRPLSMIDSVSSGSFSDEERDATEFADESDVRVGGNTGNITPPAPPPKPQDEEASAELERQVHNLFAKWASDGAVTLDDKGWAPGSPKQVKACDLPGMLAQYEEQHHRSLFPTEAWPGLEAMIDTYPQALMGPSELVVLVHHLQQGPVSTAELEQPEDVAATPADQSDGHDTSTSTDEDDSQDYSSDESTSPIRRRFSQPRSSSPLPAKGSGTTTPSLARSPRKATVDMPGTPPAIEASDRRSMRPKPQPFPSSQSASFDSASAAEGEDGPRLPSNLQHRRQIATSDPAESPHRRVSAPVPQSRRRPRTRDRRVSGEGSEEKVVLSGKGTVPPSCWNRPKPTALAARGRRTSDASASACSGEGSADGSLAPLSARPSHNRMVSEPAASLPPIMPRSASTGFVFPRTSQERPQVSTDEWAAAQQERWAAEMGDMTEVAHGSSSRGASPGIEDAAYQSFGAMSPTLNGGFSSRPSSAAGRRVSAGGGYGMQREDSGDWKERFEAAHSRHAERERKFQSDTQKQEDHIADLTNTLESTNNELIQKRKDLQEHRAREARANERIASLETELSHKVKALTGTEARVESLTQQVSEFHATIGTQRKNLDEQERQLTIFRRDEQLHADRTAEWDEERELSRQKRSIQLEEIEKLHEKVIEADVLRDEARTMRMEIDRLSQDLVDARRQANEPRSTPNTLTRGSGESIGIELRQSTRSERARPDVRRTFQPLQPTVDLPSEEADAVDVAVDELDEANTSVGRAFGVPAPPVDAEEEPDGSVSTEPETEAEEEEEEQQRTPTLQGDQSQMQVDTSTESSPPTYDEASLEKRITLRLHPPHATSDPSRSDAALAEVHVALSNEQPEESAYLLLRNELGIRCTAIEQLIEKHQREHPKVAPTTPVVESTEEEADNSAVSISGTSSSESTTMPSDEPDRFTRLRKLPRDVSDRAASLLERATHYVSHDVLQAILHSSAATASFYGAHQMAIWSMLIFVVGAAVGARFFPQAHPFNTPTVVLESAKEWSIANSFEAARKPWLSGELHTQVAKTWLERFAESISRSRVVKPDFDACHYVPT